MNEQEWLRGGLRGRRGDGRCAGEGGEEGESEGNRHGGGRRVVGGILHGGEGPILCYSFRSWDVQVLIRQIVL